ncbi:transcriptional regulator [Cupriavidus basilensis]|uniref:Transcriptional regulator n=1 Tax=Cupriavidus basilensis TaxID=68895 RepID=A0ABT6AKT1_9BURK|nr:transcriptional regulator [Cupriavidus basilensis]MDF3833200.1 transcriptional regulator [Cupriavidus basilensis]
MTQTRISAPGRAELDLAFTSFFGMDGGNPDAALWVCDVAPLFSCMPSLKALRPEKQPGSWNAAFRRANAHFFQQWQTHYRIARVIAAAYASTLAPEHSPIDATEYFYHYLYAPHGWEFKLNLFPFPENPRPSRPWNEAFEEDSVLLSKSAYLHLCRNGGRFRFISKLRHLHQPRIILCLGQRHRYDYLRAFGFEGIDGIEEILQPADVPQSLYVFEHERTALVLSPSLGGPKGLSSNVLLDALGAYLARRLDASDFPPHPGARLTALSHSAP